MNEPEEAADKKRAALFSVMMQMPMLLNATDEKVISFFSSVCDKIIELLSATPDESVGFDLGESKLYACFDDATYTIELTCKEIRIAGKVTLTETGFTTAVTTTYSE
ncbi:MAG: hypothetical protein IAE94_05240 [Chthoniobacterales bacterium]|nr:hypothetical protein [Chthoniobacterales bacterium]